MNVRSLSVGFLGAGAMAEALISGTIKAGTLNADQIIAGEPLEPRREYIKQRYGIEVFAENGHVVERADIIILAVKPQVLSQAAPLLRGLLTGKLVISIAAGITLKQLANWLGDVAIIRAVPNTPCLVGEGISALAGNSLVEDRHLTAAKMIFEAVGPVYLLQETLMDAVTGLSGSGPAYVYLVIEALSDGGVMAGLPRELATRLAAQTVLGSAKMVLETGKHPGELKDMVTSPAGTTIAALQCLEMAGVRGAFMEAVMTAKKRSGELAGEK